MSLTRFAKAIGIRALGTGALLSLGTAPAYPAFDFSYSGYIRTHLSVNLQDTPELQARRDGQYFSLGSRIDEADFEEIGGQGELSMVRHTLKLDGLLNLGFAEVAGVVRLVKETHTDYERRLQTAAQSMPLRIIDGTINNGGVLGSLPLELGGLDAITAVAPLLYAAADGENPPPTLEQLTGVLDAVGGARGSAILAGCAAGMCGGRRFFDEYDDQELRELFVQFDIGPYAHFRLGRQQVVWGETDFFRAMDIIHGYDLRWRLFLELENEELRKPLILANVSFDIPWIDGAVQFIYRPGWDAGDDSVTTLPLSGGRWTPQPLRGLDATSLAPYNYHHNSGDENDPNYGMRIAGVFKQVNWSLNYYRNQSQLPVVSRNPRIGGTPGIGAYEGRLGDGTRIELGQLPEDDVSGRQALGDLGEIVFPMVETFGVTANAYIGGFWDLVLRFEAAYVPNQPFNAGTNTWGDLVAFYLGFHDGQAVGERSADTNTPIAGVPDGILGTTSADLFGANNPVLYDMPDGADPTLVDHDGDGATCTLCVFFPGLREVEEKKVLNFMIGFDKQPDTTGRGDGILSFLNTQRPAVWLFQLFDTWVLDWDKDDQLLELPSYAAPRRRHTAYLTNALILNYNYDTILPGIAHGIDVQNADMFILPFVDLVYGNNWRIHAEASFFLASHVKKDNFGSNFADGMGRVSVDQDTRLLGALANHDQATIRITYQF